MNSYDVIIVGAGAGGGVAAGVLAEAGKRVLLLERGRDLSFEEIGRDHLRNQRYAAYGHNAGPDVNGNPRVFVEPDGVARTIRPHQGGYHNNAACVGGGTRVYGAQAWRFLPEDFRMASIYGVPVGSSLSDWPIGYDDLEPWYDRVEWEMGVAGEVKPEAHHSPRKRGFPMPPVALNKQGRMLRDGAASIGLPTVSIPLLINSVPYNDRPACVHCQHCVGFGCPVDAKTGSQNTLTARALATGRCELATEVMAAMLDTDAAGKVVGVSYFDRENREVAARAEVVVLAAGAIETARLLLHSATAQEPAGIGNAHDQVGRSLQGHYYIGASGLAEQPIYDGIGPGATTATCRYNHGNDGIVGGGMIADDFIKLPIIAHTNSVPPWVPKWGIENKRWMRDNYRRIVDVKGPVHDIPSPDARVTLDADVRDRWGLRVARLSGTTHPETVRTANFMMRRAKDWLKASGVMESWAGTAGLSLSGGQHQAGTCRMGDDPRTSVVDVECRVHGHDNLYVADGSVHVTNGGFNPVLTILALAYRTASHIAGRW